MFNPGLSVISRTSFSGSDQMQNRSTQKRGFDAPLDATVRLNGGREKRSGNSHLPNPLLSSK